MSLNFTGLQNSWNQFLQAREAHQPQHRAYQPAFKGRLFNDVRDSYVRSIEDTAHDGMPNHGVKFGNDMFQASSQESSWPSPAWAAPSIKMMGYGQSARQSNPFALQQSPLKMHTLPQQSNMPSWTDTLETNMPSWTR